MPQIPGLKWFAQLSRRLRTLIVGAVLLIVLGTLFVYLPVPYVIESPGPTFNVLGKDDNGDEIIVITGTDTNTTTGNLNMTTVNVTSPEQKVSAINAFVGWLRHDQVVIPHDSVYPPGKSDQQIEQENHQDFASAQDSAIAAASCELGYPSEHLGVVSVDAAGPSAGKLQANDIITAIAGTAMTTTNELSAVMANQKPGTATKVDFKRQGKADSVTVTLGEPLTGRTGASLGIGLGDVCQAPFEIDLGLGNEIGGPSAGLMFALGIVAKVGDENVTDGRFIAGTGTIDPKGTVGPIGGIALKMIAAKDAGAKVFLAPQDNCAEVVGATPKGLDVVKVDTLEHAIDDLNALEQGKTVPHC